MYRTCVCDTVCVSCVPSPQTFSPALQCGMAMLNVSLRQVSLAFEEVQSLETDYGNEDDEKKKEDKKNKLAHSQKTLEVCTCIYSMCVCCIYRLVKVFVLTTPCTCTVYKFMYKITTNNMMLFMCAGG